MNNWPQKWFFLRRKILFFFFFRTGTSVIQWESVFEYWIKKKKGKKKIDELRTDERGCTHARVREWRTRRLRPIGRSPRLSPKGRTKRLINHSGMLRMNLFLYLCGVVSDSGESILSSIILKRSITADIRSRGTSIWSWTSRPTLWVGKPRPWGQFKKKKKYRGTEFNQERSPLKERLEK